MVPLGRWVEAIVRWYWHHFLKGVCFHVPLVLLLAALLALPFNLFGEGLGIAQLIWYDDWWKRFLTGAAMTVVAIQSLFISYLLWDRARRMGRLDSDPGPLPFRWFVVYTTGCLIATVALLALLWAVVGWVSDVDPEPDPVPLDDPRPGWLRAAVPKPSATWAERAWLFAALPLGVAATAALAVLAAWAGAGRWLAGLRLVVRARQWLLAHDRLEPRADERMHAARRAAGIVVVIGVWVTCPVVTANREPISFAVMTLVTTLALLGFLASLFVDLWRLWRSPRVAALAFLLNLLAFLVPVFAGVSFVLCTYRFWWAVVAAVGAALAFGALGAALPGPAGAWLGRALAPRPHLHRRRHHHHRHRDTDPLQLWPFIILAGMLFFLPFDLVPAMQSPPPIVCGFLFLVLIGYGMATVAVRRALAAVLVALTFLAVLAGIERYKYRFDGFDRAEEGDYARPLDLRAEAERDNKRQDAFDAAFRDFQAARAEKLAAGNALFSHPAIIALLDLDRIRSGSLSARDATDYLTNGLLAIPSPPPLVFAAVPELVQLSGRYTRARERFDFQQHRLRVAWREMQSANRVLAPRLSQPLRDEDDEDEVLNRAPDGRPLPDDNLLFHPRDWKLSGAQKNGPLVVIAVSGGGLRSAAWTFTVLRTLEERFADQGIDFPGQVRIITGASGGMLGAAYYVATLPTERPLANKDYHDQRAANLDAYYERLTADHLTPIVKQQVFEDVPSQFAPWAARNDRGKELERSWSVRLDGALDRSFADLRADERAGRIPSLVFTPMMVEDGRRLIVSNLDMRHAVINDGNLLHEGAGDDPGLECHSRDALELFRLFPSTKGRFRLSTAARMSASFPLFSPAVSLPVVPRRRIVDAGYYDNYGVNVAATWLKGLSFKWLQGNSSKVLLIQIRDGVDQPQRKLRRLDSEGSTRFTRSTEEMSSPVEGIYNARIASSSFRNDDLLGVLSRLYTERLGETPGLNPHNKRPFQIVNFEFTERAALSWYLSGVERDRVKDAMNKTVAEFDIDYRKRVELILSWWRSETRWSPPLSLPDP